MPVPVPVCCGQNSHKNFLGGLTPYTPRTLKQAMKPGISDVQGETVHYEHPEQQTIRSYQKSRKFPICDVTM